MEYKQRQKHYYLDHNTDIQKLEREMVQDFQEQLSEWLPLLANQIQSREIGEYFTIREQVKLLDGTMEDMTRFYKGVVLSYFFRQEYDFWEPRIPAKYLETADKQIKKMVGFILYDWEGKPTKTVNSITNFQQTKQFNDFLKSVEEVCFKDQEYLFPDSKRYKEIKKQKGEKATKLQFLNELKTYYKNKFKQI